MEEWLMGLDIGGTKCAVSLARVQEAENGQTQVEICAKSAFPTRKCDPDAVLEDFTREMNQLMTENGRKYEEIGGIGISCGGPLDSVRGVIQSPPNLPGWDNIEIVRYFESRTGCRVKLQNDANACAVAEWKYGAGRGCRNMIFLTFGTGLGAGLILDNHLYSGTNDMAGEIGHVRLAKDGPVGYGKNGSCEGFCSGGGLRQLGIAAVRKAVARGEKPALLERAGSEDDISARLIAEMAREEKDPLCLRVYRQCGRRLGETLSILIDLFNPERIVLGGVYMRSRDLLIPEMNRVLEKETLLYSRQVCEIVPAGLGEKVGDYAAIAVAALQ